MFVSRIVQLNLSIAGILPDILSTAAHSWPPLPNTAPTASLGRNCAAQARGLGCRLHNALGCQSSICMVRRPGSGTAVQERRRDRT